MLSTPVGRMRLISLVEGVSFLILLGIAMPLKYLAGVPEVVSVVGAAHGVLFILYAVAAGALMLALKWSPLWFVGAMIASVVPFGTFYLDARLKRFQQGKVEV
jgi:integral membrane protein